MAKFITAREAAELIKDGASIGVAGMGLSGFPEEVVCAIRDRFKETGRPKALELHQGSAMGGWGVGNSFDGWDKILAKCPSALKPVRADYLVWVKPAPALLQNGVGLM